MKQRPATQVFVAVSGGEAEHSSLLRVASRGVVAQASARDPGCRYQATLHTDSSAARGVASRSGAGRLRHIECRASGGAGSA